MGCDVLDPDNEEVLDFGWDVLGLSSPATDPAMQAVPNPDASLPFAFGFLLGLVLGFMSGPFANVAVMLGGR